MSVLDSYWFEITMVDTFKPHKNLTHALTGLGETAVFKVLCSKQYITKIVAISALDEIFGHFLSLTILEYDAEEILFNQLCHQGALCPTRFLLLQ